VCACVCVCVRAREVAVVARRRQRKAEQHAYKRPRTRGKRNANALLERLTDLLSHDIHDAYRFGDNVLCRLLLYWVQCLHLWHEIPDPHPTQGVMQKVNRAR